MIVAVNNYQPFLSFSHRSPSSKLAKVELLFDRRRQAGRAVSMKKSPTARHKSPRLRNKSPKTSPGVSFDLKSLITPEIALQGDLPKTLKCVKGLSESPLDCEKLFDSSSSEGTFCGFSPSITRQAFAQLRSQRRDCTDNNGDVSAKNVVCSSRRRKVAARRSPRKGN